ncbi:MULTISPECIES: type II toxin-antitoxin system YhaV family toxin [unclassified Methylobacterium]|uniref:type II toxin-antitoxin system YhaV family toxin n=1 Tax=unclassified Methylobacterium TaxID=2615210 RepID=UPI0011C1EB20|nr:MULTISPECIES: type II toxin-antitoxin system YhaV family toxin [unclassified Methylobacterium]QEE38671.1 type II toxin-antitoxin system YhaV family toxin [Methylobacterium sp. WL1]TXN55084.1 type II toxin-antitoxin system YhaV family toxin [Methylobacterium sp. WL2]
MTPPGRHFSERNGWRLYQARAFVASLAPLAAEVERLAEADPGGYAAHPKAKLLTRIRQLIADEIPRDPNAHAYALGNTLGPQHRHWRRAKFLQRFRLFFRFDSASRIIVYAWVNDENTLRKAGSRSDPYAVFAQRLNAGDPPDGWEDLLADAHSI